MGGTLPLFCRQFVTSTDRIAGSIGFLYGLNTLGAALGCAAGQELGNAEGMMITFDGCPSGSVQVTMAPDPTSDAQQVSIISMP